MRLGEILRQQPGLESCRRFAADVDGTPDQMTAALMLPLRAYDDIWFELVPQPLCDI